MIKHGDMVRIAGGGSWHKGKAGIVVGFVRKGKAIVQFGSTCKYQTQILTKNLEVMSDGHKYEPGDRVPD